MAVALARVLLGALLVWAGAAKIGHPEALAGAIAGFRLLPASLIAPLAVILPFFEVLLGLYLLAGLFTRIAAAVAGGTVPDLCGGRSPRQYCAAFPRTAAALAPVTPRSQIGRTSAFDLALAAIALFIAAGAPGAFALDRRLRSR